MMIVAICREMSWTYQEYMDQPSWFSDMVYEQMYLDNQKKKKIIKRQQDANK